MNKKADVWVSTVIYVGLAVTILTIVLAAGLPVINKMRDKNTVTETKEILHALDNDIRDSIHDGPGAQRTPSIKISKGEFVIDSNGMTWTLPNSKFMYSQSGEEVKEGNVAILTTATPVNNEYNVEVQLDYSQNRIHLESPIKTLSGQYNLLIKYSGVVTIGGVGYSNITINDISV